MDAGVQRTGAPADGGDLQATLTRAEGLLRTGQLSRAIDHYRWVGAHFTTRGQTEHALAVYEVLARLLPHCLHTRGMLAELHRRMGRLAHAADLYESIAQVHLAYGRLAEATHVYRLVVEIDPASVPRRVRLADLYVQLGYAREAMPQYEIAARQLRAGDRIAEYVCVAQRMLALEPVHAASLRGLVAAHLQRGNLRRAVARLQELLRARPRDDAGRELLADCLLAHGKPDRAAKALRLLADEIRGRGVHAYDDAKRLLVRAVTLHPHDRAARAALRSLEADIAEAAERDFAEDLATGVIENARAQPDDARANVIALPRPARACDPDARMLYARSG